MQIDQAYLENIDRQAEGLVGGMALPRGVMFMSTHGVGVGYHDKDGQLRSFSRPLNPNRMRRMGPIGCMLWMFVEWGALLPSTMLGPFDRNSHKVTLTGFVIGVLIGMALRLSKLAFWKVHLGFLALVALALLVFPGLRHRIQEMRRYHGAEHQLVHAVGLGESLSAESLARQPVFHPACGTAALAPFLPLMVLLPFLPWWGQLLGWPLFFVGMVISAFAILNQEQRAWARGWLRLGRWGQGFTTAPTEARHREAALAAWEALRACYPQAADMGVKPVEQPSTLAEK